MPMETAEVAARAGTENFPIASVLFPRELRPHLRAIYGFARLVDILGDEVEGDRLAALDHRRRGPLTLHLPPGRATPSAPRPRLPAGGGPPRLRRRGARPPERAAAIAARV